MTFHAPNEARGEDKDPNWLPAPSGPFAIAMRDSIDNLGRRSTACS